MKILRRLLGIVDLPAVGMRAVLRSEIAETLPRGAIRNGKVYLPGGPDTDQTPQWQGPFPPPGHIDAAPSVGAHATIDAGHMLSRAIIVACSRKTLTVRREYGRRTVTFKIIGDGTWREDGRKNGSRLRIGIWASTVKSTKSWYAPKFLKDPFAD